MAIRTKKAQFFAVAQGAVGTFQSISAATDGLKVEIPVNFDLNQELIKTAEANGSYDREHGIPSGLQVSIPISFYMKGSGAAGVEAEWAKIFKMANLGLTTVATAISGTTISFAASGAHILDSANGLAALTIGTAIAVSGAALAANNGAFLVATSAAGDITLTKQDGSAAGIATEAAGATVTIKYGVAGTAATAGTTTTATLQNPFAATLQLYRGMPVLLSGNPATPVYAAIGDYSAARVATLATLFGSALSGSTKASIPPHVLYLPSENDPTYFSAQLEEGGLRYQFKDVLCSQLRIRVPTRGVARCEATLIGRFVGEADAALTSSVVYDATRPGIFLDSIAYLNRKAVQIPEVSFEINAEVPQIDEPGDGEGFSEPIYVGRDIMMNLDVAKRLKATEDTLAMLRGTTDPFPSWFHVRGGNAAKIGQRLGFLVPESAMEQLRRGTQKDKVRSEALTFHCGPTSTGLGIAIW